MSDYQARVDSRPNGDEEPDPAAMKRFEQFLSEGGLRITPSRQAVVEVLAASSDVLSVEGICERARARGHKVGLSTVYKTLALLKRGGLVDRQPHPLKGAPAWGRARRGRLIYLLCGNATEFREPELDRVAETVCFRHRMKLVGYASTVVGTCAKCTPRLESRCLARKDPANEPFYSPG